MSALTKAQQLCAQCLRDTNMTWHAIARELGVSVLEVHRALEPDFYQDDRPAKPRGLTELMLAESPPCQMFSTGDDARVQHLDGPAVRAARARRRARETRDLTGILMGDPPKNRSVQAQRKARGATDDR